MTMRSTRRYLLVSLLVVATVAAVPGLAAAKQTTWYCVYDNDDDPYADGFIDIHQHSNPATPYNNLLLCVKAQKQVGPGDRGPVDIHEMDGDRPMDVRAHEAGTIDGPAAVEVDPHEIGVADAATGAEVNGRLSTEAAAPSAPSLGTETYDRVDARSTGAPGAGHYPAISVGSAGPTPF